MIKVLLGASATLLLTTSVAAQPASTARLKTVVLVHGAWADGSGWRGVYTRLIRDGYRVLVTQHPTKDLPSDVEYVRRVIATAPNGVLLVGHSYGGAVVTEAGNDPKVKAIVYVAAFAPDEGETVTMLEKRPVAGSTPPPVIPPSNGFILLDQAKFPHAFAQDVNPAVARFMAASQVPWGLAAGDGVITSPAWKKKPTWTIVTTNDRMIPPATQFFMAKRAKAHLTVVAASHAVYVSQPDIVTRVIEDAAHERRK